MHERIGTDAQQVRWRIIEQQPPTSTNTPAGTYAIQVVASGTGGVTQTVTVNLVVQ